MKDPAFGCLRGARQEDGGDVSFAYSSTVVFVVLCPTFPCIPVPMVFTDCCIYPHFPLGPPLQGNMTSSGF